METPPPLPTEDPPKSPVPPSSIQVSNRNNKWLDFENDAGGYMNISNSDGPPSKRAKLEDELLDGDDDDDNDIEGPDTLLGSGLAAELLEEGEIFDSESILSRTGSCTSSKSRAPSQDEDLLFADTTQSTNEEMLIAEEANTGRLLIDEDLNEDSNLSEGESTADSLKIYPNSVVKPEINQIFKSENVLPASTKSSGKSQSSKPNEGHTQDSIDKIDSSQGVTRETPLKPPIPSQGQEEFEIIDDVGSDLDEGEQDASEGGIPDNDQEESDDESDDALYDEDEIDALLEEEIMKGPQGDNSHKISIPQQKEKVVLVEKGHDPFDILPEGWVVVTHNSGMPVYLHKKSRVCTLSRPYFLGPGSTRKHDIPVSAVPCLQYRRAKEKGFGSNTCPIKKEAKSDASVESTNLVDQKLEPTKENGIETDSDPTKENKSDPHVPRLGVRVETAEDHEQQNSLGADDLREYCQNLFDFKTIKVKRFRTWKDRRKHNNLLKKVSRPALPSSTKLIRCAIPNDKDKDTSASKRKEFVLNPAGKSDICILHEYVQQALRVQPRYTFEELANSQTPFSATITIDGKTYATGYSGSKKGAKLEAAKLTLAILIPEINKLDEDKSSKEPSTSDLTLFDSIKIEDPRITELCAKAGQPGPYQVLCECLKRNYGIGDTEVQMEMKPLKHQKSEFIMKVGKHEAKVICKNKREGKQQAAQDILQKMHPHIHTWGSLLRLYDKSVLAKDQFAGDTEDKDAELESYIRLWMCLVKPMDENNSCSFSASAYCHTKGYTGEIISTSTHDLIALTSTSSQTDDDQVLSGIKTECEEDEVLMESGEVEKPKPKVKEVTWESVSEYWLAMKNEVLAERAMITVAEEEIYPHIWRHCATQTEWEGNNMFHKTTQFPEVMYTYEDKGSVRSSSSSVVISSTTYTTPSTSKARVSRSGSYQCVAVRSGSGVIIGTAPVRPGSSNLTSDSHNSNFQTEANAFSANPEENEKNVDKSENDAKIEEKQNSEDKIITASSATTNVMPPGGSRFILPPMAYPPVQMYSNPYVIPASPYSYEGGMSYPGFSPYMVYPQGTGMMNPYMGYSSNGTSMPSTTTTSSGQYRPRHP